MLSKSQARTFFLTGTLICSAAFILLTVDTFQRIPTQTNSDKLDPMVIKGKHLFEKNNCMGCHTIFGEGAYYAPELTKVYDRRGPQFIHVMLTDPESLYPGERKMVKYDFSEDEKQALIAFFKWIGEVDLNGFPPRPNLTAVAVPSESGDSDQAVASKAGRPEVFNQMCIACHQLKGQGGQIGPPLDNIGLRMNVQTLREWLTDPGSIRPGTKMPKLPLTEAQLTELSAFLSQLKDGGQ